MSAPETQPSPSQADLPDRDASSAVLLAIRNALTLGGSLMFTWSIGLAMRVILPRYLGPSQFGTLNFADAFTITAFVTLNLGAESYIRKEVAVRPEHGTDFFGGTFVLRILITVVTFAVMSVILAGRPPEVRYLVYLYGLTQFFVTSNATLSAMLHSKGRVGGMSALAVATKVVWAVGLLWAMAAHAGLWAYGASYLASESSETVVLFLLARKHLKLAFRVDVPETKAMLVSSLPYFLNGLATTAYGKLDVSVLDFYRGSEEVGLYGAASNVAGLALLITPLIGWVLMPMFSRAASRSREELDMQTTSSMKLILTAAIPASLLLSLGADLWIRIIFGAAYAPAASALRVLAVMFVLTYVAIISAITLIMLERAWTFTWISIAGLFVNASLNLLFVRWSVPLLGPGGGGTGCAMAMLGTEIFVVTCMAVALRWGPINRRNAAFVAKSLGAYGVVVVAHLLLAPIGYARLAVDAALYFTLAMVTGALRPREMVQAVREALDSRKTA